MPPTKVGSAVKPLSAADDNARRSAGTAKPRIGNSVRLWRLGGAWKVWSPGPEVGTWWLQPHDPDADELVELAAEDLGAVDPVIRKVAQGAVAVKTTEIRAA